MITSIENKWLIKIVDTLLSPLEYSGGHRQKQWEKGWQQNLDEHTSIPHYFGKYSVVRKNGQLIDAPMGFEYQELVTLEKEVFKKYFQGGLIYEFGCGTGHNLIHLKDTVPNCIPVGLDWVDSSVVSVKQLGFRGVRFNMFKPNYHVGVNGSVLTVAALEQLGDKFHQFIDYLLYQKPNLCVHLEPIEELMNPDNLLDYLQLQYMRKRRYLSGFLTYLRQLESEGIVEILEAKRNGVGSLFIEGYSQIIWRPL